MKVLENLFLSMFVSIFGLPIYGMSVGSFGGILCVRSSPFAASGRERGRAAASHPKS